MPETTPETPGNSLAATTLNDRELLIHAIQHLEVLAEQVGMLVEQVGEIHPAALRIDGTLAVFKPLLDTMAPNGRPDMIGIIQVKRRFGKRGL